MSPRHLFSLLLSLSLLPFSSSPRYLAYDTQTGNVDAIFLEDSVSGRSPSPKPPLLLSWASWCYNLSSHLPTLLKQTSTRDSSQKWRRIGSPLCLCPWTPQSRALQWSARTIMVGPMASLNAVCNGLCDWFSGNPSPCFLPSSHSGFRLSPRVSRHILPLSSSPMGPSAGNTLADSHALEVTLQGRLF